MSRRMELSSALESLEPRRLLSAGAATIEEQVFVRGTNHADTITISEAMVGGVKTVTVEVNDVAHHFDAAHVKSIHIDGRAGNDVMQADADVDVRLVMVGGRGDDTMSGGSAADWLDGAAGNDVIYGGGGNDQIVGRDGNDTLVGDAGNDVLDGGRGDDLLGGSDGNDRLLGRDGNDQLFGEAGDDTLLGGNGMDSLDGGAGRDNLDGGHGHDNVNGGRGVDHVIIVDGEDTGHATDRAREKHHVQS